MTDRDISNQRIVDLKKELRLRGLKVTGNKKELAERLQLATTMPREEYKMQNKGRVNKRKLKHEESREQSAIILKMPVEMIDYIFDYLNLEDLSAVSATCKRMQTLAAQVYQRTYSGILPVFNIFKGYGDVAFREDIDDDYFDVGHFIPFFDKMIVFHNTPRRGFVLREFIDRQSEFHQLKYLIVSGAHFNNIRIDRLAKILGKIEHLQFDSCDIDKNSLDKLLSLTPNIKRLKVDVSENRGNSWFTRTYLKLEHCEITSGINAMPITTFLALNPNVKKLGIGLKTLWENRHSISAAEIKLDVLAILITITNVEHVPCWQLLNEYSQIGIFKRLHLRWASLSVFDQNAVDELSIISTVHRLHLGFSASFYYVKLSSLSTLEDLSFPVSRYITDIATVAATFENLKFVHFGISSTSHLKLFIGGISKLERIQIDWFVKMEGICIGWFVEKDENVEDETVLNLIALNKERAKIRNATKVTLFVLEPTYLATKRANRDTDLDLISLKRTWTCSKREFDFDYPRPYRRDTECINRRRRGLV